MGPAKRAFGREDKEARREVILAAANRLFGQGQGELPSVAEIAAGAGLAKGTVYRYFATKETIFSALLLEGWGKVVGLLEEAFRLAAAGEQDIVGSFLAAYVAHLNSHRELLRLDALRPMLEHNLEMATLLAFKQTFLDRLATGGALIDRALDLRSGRGLKLLMRTHALTCGLWQSFGPDKAADTASEFAVFHPDFVEELSEALAEYWRGALAS